jgi:dTDP-4-dehydrorhamnose reductase
MIFISTDYVFAGLPGEAPYEVDAQPKPSNLYGRTKADGETVMLEEFDKEKGEGVGVVLRVPVLYGSAEMPAESAINSLMDVVWKAQEAKEKIKVDHWAIRYPTNTADVARVCVGKRGLPSLQFLFRQAAFHVFNSLRRS